jgi:hypothetical protein
MASFSAPLCPPNSACTRQSPFCINYVSTELIWQPLGPQAPLAMGYAVPVTIICAATA